MFFRRDKYGCVHLKEYDPATKACRPKPRSASRHLDNLTDEEIDAWIEAQVGSTVHWYTNDAVGAYVRSWSRLEASRGLDPQTVKQHKSALERFVLEFYGNKIKVRNPEAWPKHCGQFYNWMIEEKQYSHHQLRIANIAFRKFYTWLIEENHVPNVELKLRTPVLPTKETPLPRPIMPDEVYEWAEKCDDLQIRFLGLVGYFMTLRPQEAFSIRPADFRVGSQVHELEAAIAMKSNGLFNSFAVYIAKQQQSSGITIDRAKKNSKGWVCCFEKRAAEMIRDIAQNCDPKKDISRWNNRKLYEMWAELGIKDITLRDLRRASAYYLGHHTTMQPLQLMKHARHLDFKTTQLYCRQPNKGLFGDSGVWDLES